MDGVGQVNIRKIGAVDFEYGFDGKSHADLSIDLVHFLHKIGDGFFRAYVLPSSSPTIQHESFTSVDQTAFAARRTDSRMVKCLEGHGLVL